MMGTLMRAWLIQLRRDRVAMLLTFALPLVFFTIFAGLFSGMGGRGSTPKVKLVVVDEDRSEASGRFIAGLSKEDGLTVIREEGNPGAPISKERAREMVANGKVPLAAVFPKGFGQSFGDFIGGGVEVELLADTSDPVAPQMVSGLMQAAAMTAMPDLMATKGFDLFEKFAGGFTPEQQKAVDQWLPMLRQQAEEKPADGAAASTAEGDKDAAAGGGPGFRGLVGVKLVDVLGEGKTTRAITSMFAATGTGVMFLLFMASSAAGVLLEEEESGVLERLLSSRLTMGRLLVYKWLFVAGVGVAQVTVMFVWGALVFGVELWQHLPEFLVITAVTAGAASAFGMMLAAACRTRAQLGGVSTIAILTMSAVGGSMLPRALMSETMQKVGLLTFNGWALDGYYNVFWRETGVRGLWPQVTALVLMAAAFLGIARVLARRWETV
ncbi:MAG: ABC transporter permease [Phycisphaeraceae bacterium]|nr:ABC transporter permease [Phycisphaeraceae bacterium]